MKNMKLKTIFIGLSVYLVLILLPNENFALSYDDLYSYTNEETDKLPLGDDKYEFIKLGTPILFYTETYDHIYINTNGILTFGVEFPQFVNVRFPLEYPAIAPFYTNVDTSDANETTTISYFKSHDAALLNKVTNLVKLGFSDASDFKALSLFVATWENVGYFEQHNDKQNTFQVAIICGEEETFAQFLYPYNGINWIQGDIGESGLPDVRAQAGFVSEDGRYFSIKESGTKNVQYLNENSNYGVPGSWLYRIGPLSVEEPIEEPDYISPDEHVSEVPSCATSGKLKCDSSATCVDTSRGFCCKCNEGYYGNGQSCIKNDVPIRVTGIVRGTVNNETISSQLQSYVVTTDGRSYTAISPLSSTAGCSLQLAQVLGGVVGWLFAKSNPNSINGYEITGGKLNHSTVIRFIGLPNDIRIVQQFKGLNEYDQLSVDVEIYGTMPEIPIGVSLSFPDITDEYSFTSDTSIRSVGKVAITLDDREIAYDIDQQINFEKCEYADRNLQHEYRTFYNKIKKISSAYTQRENALRIGLLNRIVNDVQSNPCTDGSANCGENTLCLPDESEGYECNCKNGFAPDIDIDGVQNCVDIDECSGENICDENANCHNDLGGYSCVCREGYMGNGYTCSLVINEDNNNYYNTPTEPSDITSGQNNNGQLSPENWQCNQCSENAECFHNVCVCKNGWSGDGIECIYNCPYFSVWRVDRCVSINSEDEVEIEIQPFCTQQGCSCSTGYSLVQYGIEQRCRLIGDEDDDTSSNGSLYEDRLPCDAENNCHPNATCEWAEHDLRNKCVCNPGFDGNGYDCIEKEVSCLYENICDLHASCAYDEHIGKSICKCEDGYEGNGYTCHLAPECKLNEECGANRVCEGGICICAQGFERDLSDFCVQTGSCGGAFCAENAICQWDSIERVSYCFCPSGFIGDGLKICKPIPIPCNVRNNCGQYATCTPNYRDHRLYECECNPGYFGDGFVCMPEVNCINVPSLCSSNAQCVSTTAGLQCVCNTGFIGNGSYCAPPPSYDSGFLLLSQGVATVRIPFDGKRGRPVAMMSMAIGLDKDCSQGRVYWSDITMKQIASSKYDGSDRQVFISEDILSPEGVAVDWISRRLYWTDSTKDTIEVANLDNPKQRSVIIRKYLVNPRGIAVDPNQSKVYWSDWNRDGPKIEWSNLDGTEREILLTNPAVELPNSLAISQSTGELCFADAGTKKIECIDTYSRTLRTIAANLSYPFGLTVTNEQFYWTDWTTKKIESVDHNGNQLAGIRSPLFGNHKMYGMTAVTNECPLFYSACQMNNGDCTEERLCLVNQRSPSGRSCVCVEHSNCSNDIHLDD